MSSTRHFGLTLPRLTFMAMADCRTRIGAGFSSARNGKVKLLRGVEPMIAIARNESRGRMKHHQFLVSRELGGAGRVALDLAKFLASKQEGSPVWIPGAGPA